MLCPFGENLGALLQIPLHKLHISHHPDMPTRLTLDHVSPEDDAARVSEMHLAERTPVRRDSRSCK